MDSYTTTSEDLSPFLEGRCKKLIMAEVPIIYATHNNSLINT